jgi:hypothetical protein
MPGLSMADVACVQQGRINPIRYMDVAQCIGGVQAAVNYIAPTFGARQAVSKETLRECGKIVTEQFSDFALVEIIHAYRLWAGQKFEALEMYGGQFNVTQFARVLAAYREYRYQINQELAGLEQQEAREQRKAERKLQLESRHRKSLEGFPQTVRDAIADNRFQSPENIPVHWYEMAEIHEMINLEPGEKLAFAITAEQQVEAQRNRQLVDAKNIFASRSLRQHYESVGQTPIWIRAKQLILWAKVLGRAPQESPTTTTSPTMEEE